MCTFFQQHADEFNRQGALNELYKYIQTYNTQLVQSLQEDEFATKCKLTARLNVVHRFMNGQEDSYA